MHAADIVDDGRNRDLAGAVHSIGERKQFHSVTEALSVFEGNKLKFAPSTAFRHTSFDVVLLSALMERASGMALLDREISRPLRTRSHLADYQGRAVADRVLTFR